MPEVPDQAPTGQALENFAFYDFIEGTTFQVSEAEQIVFEGKVIPNRTEDSHDVLGTFQAASQAPWRNTPARSGDAFLAWLKSVNALMMKSRSDKRPGEWKDKPIQAGTTLFVDPILVPGTLREGFARIVALEDPFARALMTDGRSPGTRSALSNCPSGSGGGTNGEKTPVLAQFFFWFEADRARHRVVRSRGYFKRRVAGWKG